MDLFIDFLKNNYLLLIILGILLILLLLCILLLPKRFNKYWSSLLEMLPIFIKDCEDKGIKGAALKLNYVLELSLSFLSSLTGCKISILNAKYGELIKNQIETILETPQKKKED